MLSSVRGFAPAEEEEEEELGNAIFLRLAIFSNLKVALRPSSISVISGVIPDLQQFA